MKNLRSGLIYSGIFILLQTIIFVMVSRGKKMDIELYLQQHLVSLEQESSFVLKAFSREARIVFNEIFTTQEIVTLFAEARNHPRRRDELRSRLYQRLLPSYQRLLSLGFKQVHFHFSDGISFLRLHAPEQFGDQLFPFRESVRLANTEQRYMEGLEIGRNDHAYRYVFPITDGGVHLGSVEISVPFYSFENFMQEVFNVECYLLLKKEALDNKIRDGIASHYMSSLLLEKYFYENDDWVFHEHNHKGHLDLTEVARINKRLLGRIEEKTANQLSFIEPVTLSGADYLVTFISIKDISGDKVGYVITYERDTVLHAIHQKNNVIHLALALLLCVFFYFHLMLNKHRTEQIRFQQQLMEAIPSPVWFKNPEGTLSGCNTAFREMFALPKDLADYKPTDDIWGDQSAVVQQMDRDILAKKKVIKKELICDFSDGSHRTLVVHKAALLDSGGRVLFLVGSAFDISERKEAENLLFESHMELDQVFNTAANGMRIVDPDHVIQRVNKAFCDMVNKTADEIVGKKCYEILPGPNCGTKSCPLDCLASGAASFKTKMQKKIAPDKDIECIVTAASLRDRKGEFTGFVEDFQDITLFRKMEQKLRDIAITDELTTICNRRGFLLFAEKQLAAVRRNDQDAFVTYLDIDNLKTINDLQGHKVGDLAIRTTAQLLKQMFRKPDVVSRLGGDEFAIFTSCQSGSNSDEAISRRLVEAVEAINAKGELSFKMSISFGIARFREKDSLEQLMNRADEKMYQAKREKKRLTESESSESV